MYGFHIEKEQTYSNSKQLQNQIREAIITGRLKAGDQLPPTRKLSLELKIARNSVIESYEQLIAEGYLESIEGSGTYIADIGNPSAIHYNTSTYTDLPENKPEDVISFNAGCPDELSFPKNLWAKVIRNAVIDDTSVFSYTGTTLLQKEICSYVFRCKGIVCDYRQIVIVNGASGGLDIIAKALVDQSNQIAMEDPCIHFVHEIFAKHNYKIHPVPVDNQGIIMDKLYELNNINLIYTVPSHQFPIGGVMPAKRRLSLLSYAVEKNAYVIEDDYDSEYRYKGEALQALRNLNPERVIFVGSFSKIFSPYLRLGYLILPFQLCPIITDQIERSNLWTNTAIQLAMAELLNRKYIDRHTYRMKKIYEEKRIYLMKKLYEEFGDRIIISGEYAGLHFLVTFDKNLGDDEIKRMETLGVEADFVEDYALIKKNHENMLVIGYGNLSFSQMDAGTSRLKQAIYPVN
jgi:GntR family transcriptional regulator/MocR family aminotransferase